MGSALNIRHINSALDRQIIRNRQSNLLRPGLIPLPPSRRISNPYVVITQEPCIYAGEMTNVKG